MDLNLLISALIFILTFGAIVSGKIQRSIAAMGGAIAMVAVGLLLGFYGEGMAIESIEWNTIGLLLGMMIIVGVLEDTGMFEALSIYAAKLSRGRYFYMIMFFGFLTAFASTTIDNVTTILLVAPITLSICADLGVDPKPILLTEALFSDVGGVATLVGDPPNVMISSAAELSYMDFISNLGAVVIICTLATLIAFKLLFAEKAKEENSKIQEKLEAEENPIEKNPSEEIKDWNLLKKGIFVLVLVILLFIVHHRIGLMPATVALFGAGIILAIARPEMEEIIMRVKWSTLLFFAGLFVVVGGVEQTGLLEEIAAQVLNTTAGATILSALAILLITAIGSAFVDNIPFTAAMIPIIGEMTTSLGIESSILWWALAFGAGFGANGTYIGSSANVITVKISEDYGRPISFWYWLKNGTIIMGITVGIAGLALAAQIMTETHIPLLPG